MRCSIAGCKSYRLPQHISVHSLYRGGKFNEDWIESIESLNGQYIDVLTVSKGFGVCDEHFDKSCRRNLGPKNHLTPNAIPTIFPKMFEGGIEFLNPESYINPPKKISSEEVKNDGMEKPLFHSNFIQASSSEGVNVYVKREYADLPTTMTSNEAATPNNVLNKSYCSFGKASSTGVSIYVKRKNTDLPTTISSNKVVVPSEGLDKSLLNCNFRKTSNSGVTVYVKRKNTDLPNNIKSKEVATPTSGLNKSLLKCSFGKVSSNGVSVYVKKKNSDLPNTNTSNEVATPSDGLNKLLSNCNFGKASNSEQTVYVKRIFNGKQNTNTPNTNISYEAATSTNGLNKSLLNGNFAKASSSGVRLYVKKQYNLPPTFTSNEVEKQNKSLNKCKENTSLTPTTSSDEVSTPSTGVLIENTQNVRKGKQAFQIDQASPETLRAKCKSYMELNKKKENILKALRRKLVRKERKIKLLNAMIIEMKNIEYK